ncbi:hypothetical protein [Rhabdothermincola sp.]|uniref:hypothetical protein n=1 Tax=Rhabdothermincola sp. TaxID=2820405 RepID=UPI002FE2E876
MRSSTPSLPAVRGWCPSLAEPLEARDGWLVRLPVGCRPLSSQQWRVVATVAETRGNGLVEITRRGNLQLRGLAVVDLDETAAALVRVGLASRHPATDGRRAVVLDPLLDVGPAPDRVADRLRLARRLEQLVVDLGDGLPAKWWAVVDGGGPWPVPVPSADVAVLDRRSCWEVRVAGAVAASACDPAGVERAVEPVIRRCAAAGCRARDLPGTAEPSAAPPSGADGRSAWWGIRLVGDRAVAPTAPALGVATAGALHVVATIAEGPVSVRPEPGRGVLLVASDDGGTDAGGADLAGALEQLAALGWVVSPHDPRRSVSACIGSHGCASALVDTHALARAWMGDGRDGPLHVSGCPKRCGAPPGARELVATSEGLRMVGW